MQVVTTSAIKVKSELMVLFEEVAPDLVATSALHVVCKKAANRGMHTLAGLSAYSKKYKGQKDYENFSLNITPELLEEGQMLLAQYGQAIKHRVELGPNNLFNKAFQFWDYDLHRKFDVSLGVSVYAMVRSGQYYLSPQFIIPYWGVGLDVQKVSALWRCLVQPDDVSIKEIEAILFKEGDRYFNTNTHSLPSEVYRPDDPLIESLVTQAADQGVKISELIGRRACFRDSVRGSGKPPYARYPYVQPGPMFVDMGDSDCGSLDGPIHKLVDEIEVDQGWGMDATEDSFVTVESL